MSPDLNSSPIQKEVYQPMSKLTVVGMTMCLLTAAASAEARPKHWYKDWKWWAGEAVIAGAFVADSYSTSLAQSRRVGIETNPFLGPHPNNGAIARLSLTGFAIETTLHAYMWHLSNEDTKGWRAFGYTAVPGAGAVILGRSAAHNFKLVDNSK
jgi:hypothetical protein